MAVNDIRIEVRVSPYVEILLYKFVVDLLFG